MRAGAAVAIVLASLAAIASACGGSGSSDGGGGADAAAACPNDLPEDCPSPPPSYKGEVGAIIADKCQNCHADGGPGQQTRDLSTFDRIQTSSGPMLTQVYQCLMPLPDAGQLTPEERQALLGWLVCGAPDN